MALSYQACAGGAVAIAAAALCSGCGSSSPSRPARSATSSRQHSSSDSSTAGATTTPRIVVAGRPIGATEHVATHGSRLAVTVEHLIDPLPSSGAALLPGTRAVGVLVELANRGPAVYDSSATGDFSVVASSGEVTPLLVRRGACQTPLRDFDNYIVAGEVRSGCVAFAVARGARVIAVRFSPHASAAGRLTWRAGG